MVTGTNPINEELFSDVLFLPYFAFIRFYYYDFCLKSKQLKIELDRFFGGLN